MSTLYTPEYTYPDVHLSSRCSGDPASQPGTVKVSLRALPVWASNPAAVPCSRTAARFAAVLLMLNAKSSWSLAPSAVEQFGNFQAKLSTWNVWNKEMEGLLHEIRKGSLIRNSKQVCGLGIQLMNLQLKILLQQLSIIRCSHCIRDWDREWSVRYPLKVSGRLPLVLTFQLS